MMVSNIIIEYTDISTQDITTITRNHVYGEAESTYIYYTLESRA